MAKVLPTECFLCGKPIRYHAKNKQAIEQGIAVGAETHDLDAKSEMHYGHTTGKVRSREQFQELADAAWKAMDVQKPRGSRICCFECHEVILHNPVLSESQLDRLRLLFSGKTFEERVILLNRIIEAGLDRLSGESAT